MRQFFNFNEMSREQWALSDAEVERKERYEQGRRRENAYQKRVPERYWFESLGTFVTDTDERRNVLCAAQDFAKAARCGAFRSLVLLGHAGTGKTHLACGIVRECGGTYRKSADIIAEVRRAHSFSSRDTERDVFTRYGSEPLLVVDEVGRVTDQDEERYTLYQLIDERYNRRLPTVLVSNLGKKDFLNYAGIATVDRLSESAIVVELPGQSYRAALRA